MNISGVIGLILLGTLVFFAFGLITNEFEKSYVDTGITNATRVNDSIVGDFDDTEFFNESIQPIQEAFKKIEKSEGFFDTLIGLGIAVPIAIITVPRVILTMVGQGGSRAIQTLNILGIPPTMIMIAIVGLTIFIIFKLVSFWKGNEV